MCASEHTVIRQIFFLITCQERSDYMEYMENLTEYVEKQASLCQQHDRIDKELYAK